MLEVLEEALSQQNDFKIIKTFNSSKGLIKFIKDNSVDIILMDVDLGEKYDGIYLTHKIKDFSKAKIIILSSCYYDNVFVDSFNAGAVHYVLKGKMDILPDTIRTTHKGNRPIEVLADSFRKLNIEKKIDKLSPAEEEILELSVNKLNREQISIKSNKSVSTIKNQITSILKKFNVKTLKEATQIYKKVKSPKKN